MALSTHQDEWQQQSTRQWHHLHPGRLISSQLDPVVGEREGSPTVRQHGRLHARELQNKMLAVGTPLAAPGQVPSRCGAPFGQITLRLALDNSI